MKIPQIFDYATEEYIDLPWKWEICFACDGHGKSSAYLGAFTHDELFEDLDFAEEYLEGRYDRPCDCCDGQGKVKVADHNRMTEAQEAAYRQELADRAADRAEYEAEKRFGC